MSAAPSATALGASARQSPLTIALAGMASLAVAMGVGRFAFTPILPLMLSDGSIDLHGASDLAAVNYVGYLLGAVLCALQPMIWARCRSLPGPTFASLVRFGLATTTLLTLAMVLPAPGAWPLWRGLAGVTCALAFVYTTGWCLARLAEAGKSNLGGLIFVGPGAGILASGLLGSPMAAHHWQADWAWAAFAALGALLTLVIWPVFRGGPERLAPASDPATQAPAAGSSPAHEPRQEPRHEPRHESRHESRHDRGPAPGAERWMLAFAYGLAGFGYIITATFLPVIARASLGPSRWTDLFWPVFGAAVMFGAFASSLLPATGELRRRLIVGYLLQATGVATPLLWPTPAGFVLGCVLLGLPFTALTFFAMQEARRLQPASAAALMGLLTAVYGLGQIAGPPLVSWRLAASATAADGFASSLVMAVAALLTGAVVYAVMIHRYPVTRPDRVADDPVAGG